ncbi:hypothetical protein [Actinomadura macrotermitis]|uniref:Uncharacterized protein n=1 Tax=Actinomadura macrotermitis TaxID=2585200 RepID=A0A7K0BW56_9ACTN|nr:hypothetical protein [Actinomadura macrotermitis]MQY05132.1 hypothetical protein [Actinomadura macrotermitis]
MGGQDDFGLWERELRPEEEEDEGRPVLVAAALTAAGFTALMLVGDVRIGLAGLAAAVLILVLWRIGF